MSKLSSSHGAATALILILMLAGCDESSPSTGGVEGGSLPASKEAVTVQASAGEQPLAAFLVVPQGDFNPSDLQKAVRNAGYACVRARRFNQLELNGKRTSIYKIDCLEYSYQFTRVGGKPHLKRWNGILSGE
jgi:hypothetical protein